MFYRERITVYSEVDGEHINTLCEQNVAVFVVKTGGT
jgi:hypothetical protein